MVQYRCPNHHRLCSDLESLGYTRFKFRFICRLHPEQSILLHCHSSEIHSPHFGCPRDTYHRICGTIKAHYHLITQVANTISRPPCSDLLSVRSIHPTLEANPQLAGSQTTDGAKTSLCRYCQWRAATLDCGQVLRLQ